MISPEKKNKLTRAERQFYELYTHIQELATAAAALVVILAIWHFSQTLPIEEEARKQQRNFERSFGIALTLTETQINNLIAHGVLDTNVWAESVTADDLANIIPSVTESLQTFTDAAQVPREFAPHEKIYLQFSIDALHAALQTFEKGDFQGTAKQLYLYPIVMETFITELSGDMLKPVNDELARSKNFLSLDIRYFVMCCLLWVFMEKAQKDIIS